MKKHSGTPNQYPGRTYLLIDDLHIELKSP